MRLNVVAPVILTWCLGMGFAVMGYLMAFDPDRALKWLNVLSRGDRFGMNAKWRRQRDETPYQSGLGAIIFMAGGAFFVYLSVRLLLSSPSG